MHDDFERRSLRDLERRIEMVERSVASNGWGEYRREVVRMISAWDAFQSEWVAFQKERGASNRDRLLLIAVVAAVGMVVLNWLGGLLMP